MSWAVFDLGNQCPALGGSGTRTHFVNKIAYRCYHLDIGPLTVAADVVSLSNAAIPQYGAYRRAMVIHKQPITHAFPISINRERLALKRIENHERNELFGKLKRPVVA